MAIIRTKTRLIKILQTRSKKYQLSFVSPRSHDPTIFLVMVLGATLIIFTIENDYSHILLHLIFIFIFIFQSLNITLRPSQNFFFLTNNPKLQFSFLLLLYIKKFFIINFTTHLISNWAKIESNFITYNQKTIQEQYHYY